MACQRLNLPHRRILPDYYLVEAVAVGRDELVGGLGEEEVAHLRSCINTINWLQSVCVPKSDASVCGATASGEKARLVWAPCDGLDCRLMLRKLCHWLVTILVPNHQLVIIAATCELLPIVRPFEPTDLLLVARVLVRDAVLDP